ncbi:efflux transporter outer membrane subunit [bacterium]|nr:efflux transporter outer membrane subunit [bacterium]
MKKIIATALLLSFTTLQATPVLAVTNTTTASPKQFKSMVKKDTKVSDEYKYEYVNLNWWNTFNDDLLNGYIQQAIANNYDLKMATLTVEEYYQQTKLQFANQLPQLMGGAGGGWMKMPNSTKTELTLGLPILVNYEADIFLKNRDKTKSSKKLWENSKFDERAAYIAIAGAVGTTYLNIVSLDKAIELQTEIVELRQQIFDLMQLSNKEGLVSTADVIRANKNLVQGETQLIELKKGREILLHQLCVLIGDSPENSQTLKRASLDEINYNNYVPEYIESEIITQRPDYLIAENLVEKAGLDVKIAKKEFLPSINLLGGGIFSSDDFGSLFTTSNMLLGLAGGIMAPLFTGGRNTANLRLKKATYERVLQNYYKTNITAIQEVSDALVKVKMDKEKVDQTLKQANLESADFKFSEMKYDEGTISLLDLAQKRENLLYINQLVAQQKAEFMVDYIGLYKATGSKLQLQ